MEGFTPMKPPEQDFNQLELDRIRKNSGMEGGFNTWGPQKYVTEKGEKEEQDRLEKAVGIIKFKIRRG